MTIIRKYLPQINSNCFRAINKVYTNLGLKPLKDFQLLQKTSGTDVFRFASDYKCQVPYKAVEYTYVNIGKKSDLSYKSEVLSFFDASGRIIQRYFRKGGQNTELYTYDYARNKRTIEKSRLKTSHINKEFITPELANIAGRWVKESTEPQIIYKFIRDLVRKGKEATMVLSKKVQHNPQNADVERITFTRYPINLGFEPKTNKQVVSGTITHHSTDIELTDVRQSGNIDIDLRDEFLKYRFIDPRSNEGMELMTRQFLREKSLDDLGIFVSASNKQVPKNSSGYFSVWDQEICYSPNIKAGDASAAVNTAAHEVEHAYQHSLIGRIGRGYTKYETNALQKFGFPDEAERNRAVYYAMARDDYPKLSETEDLSQNIRYMNNLLEVDARKAGKAAEENYRKYRANFEFFEQFYHS